MPQVTREWPWPRATLRRRARVACLRDPRCGVTRCRASPRASHHMSATENPGLSPAEASARRTHIGLNRLFTPAPVRFWTIAGQEITEPMILLLLTVGVFYTLWGGPGDASPSSRSSSSSWARRSSMEVTRKGWSEGKDMIGMPGNSEYPSSGCESRPAKAQTRRPVTSLATAGVTPAAIRRHVRV